MLTSLTDVARIRQDLPWTADHIYLNTATFGPLPRCVPEAMGVWLQKEWSTGRLGMQMYEQIGKLYAEARSQVARILNAEPGEIALTENTGEGIGIICHGFNWQPGDEVIITNHEHISVHFLLRHLSNRYGITVRVADLGMGGGRPADEAIAELMTSRTRLIVISHVSFMTGAILDVQAVTLLAHRANILVLVDGAQAVGAIPLDVKALGADFYVFPMQKWLCGPDGTGGLYVRHEVLEKVQPTYVGWCLLKFEAGGKMGFHDSAQRFELGSRQSAAIAGQMASLRWLEETVGYQWLFERISFLNSYASSLLKDLPGLTILTPHPGSSGVLSFLLDGQSAEPLVRQLQQEHHIHLRSVFEHNSLRISTGFYNTEDELDYLAQVLHKQLHS